MEDNLYAKTTIFQITYNHGLSSCSKKVACGVFNIPRFFSISHPISIGCSGIPIEHTENIGCPGIPMVNPVDLVGCVINIADILYPVGIRDLIKSMDQNLGIICIIAIILVSLAQGGLILGIFNMEPGKRAPSPTDPNYKPVSSSSSGPRNMDLLPLVPKGGPRLPVIEPPVPYVGPPKKIEDYKNGRL